MSKSEMERLVWLLLDTRLIDYNKALETQFKREVQRLVPENFHGSLEPEPEELDIDWLKDNAPWELFSKEMT